MREIVVYDSQPVQDAAFVAEARAGDSILWLFRVREGGRNKNKDLSYASFMYLAVEDALGAERASQILSKTHPEADWENGLIACPVGPASVTTVAADLNLALMVVESGTIIDSTYGRAITNGVGHVRGRPGFVSADPGNGGGTGMIGGFTGNRYVQCFDTPSTHWEIVHNLEGYPSVVILEEGGDDVLGELTYVSENELHIDFLTPIAGCAYLN